MKDAMLFIVAAWIVYQWQRNAQQVVSGSPMAAQNVGSQTSTQAGPISGPPVTQTQTVSGSGGSGGGWGGTTEIGTTPSAGVTFTPMWIVGSDGRYTVQWAAFQPGGGAHELLRP